MTPTPPPEMPKMAPPRAPTSKELQMLLILARQAIGDGIKSGRDLGAVYPMLKAIETTEDYARHLENAQKIQPPLRGNTNASDNTAPVGPESV